MERNLCRIGVQWLLSRKGRDAHTELASLKGRDELQGPAVADQTFRPVRQPGRLFDDGYTVRRRQNHLVSIGTSQPGACPPAYLQEQLRLAAVRGRRKGQGRVDQVGLLPEAVHDLVRLRGGGFDREHIDGFIFVDRSQGREQPSGSLWDAAHLILVQYEIAHVGPG